MLVKIIVKKVEGTCGEKIDKPLGNANIHIGDGTVKIKYMPVENFGKKIFQSNKKQKNRYGQRHVI